MPLEQSGNADNLSKMADRRRRRALEDEGEEKENAVKGRPSECESEGEPTDAEIVSEYESAAEDSREAGGEEDSEEGSEEETEEETEEGSEEEEEEDEEEYTDDEDVIIEGEEHIEEERQSGDGEEQPDKENVDDDEDKKNPAYVPRKGAFYEHDLRTGEEDTAEETPKPKKKLWQDEGKWQHDRYMEDQQAPKSREEIMALYGYDIRASDKPPDAPPPRKMRGRGRGRPQRNSKLSDFIEAPSEPRPPAEPQHQRMAVIDTTDYSHRQKSRPPPPPQPEAFEDVEEDIDVPYMTTIDTTQSSADSYQPGGYRRRGGGPRQRRDRQSFEENQKRNSRRSYEEGQNYRERRSYGERGGGRQGYNSYHGGPRDLRYGQSQDKYSPRHDSYAQDYPSLGEAGPDDQDSGVLGPRGSGPPADHRPPHQRSADQDAGADYSQHYNQAPRARGPTSKPTRGRERNDRSNRPPRYSRLEREERLNNGSRDVVPAAREFTNSSFRSAASADSMAAAENHAQVEGAGTGVSGRQTSQDVVISNKENVQTISVTITNTTTERKSYTKERRGKGGTAVGPAVDRGEGGEAPMPAMIEAPPPSGARGDQAYEKPGHEKRYGRGPATRQDSGEQTRPKRYSSQRQRNMMEMGYGDPHQQPPQQPPPPQQQPVQQQQKQQKQLQQQPPSQQQQQQQQQQPKKGVNVDSGSGYYKPAVFPAGHPPAPLFHPELGGTPRPGHPPPPQDPAAFSTAMLQPPISYHLPVSSPGMPSPPRLMGPNLATAPPGTVPVPISNASPQLLPAPYLTAPGVLYTSPPPPPGASPQYQVPLGYTSPPPAAPPPSLPQQSVATAQSQPEVHRGGTVYFPPYLQQPSSRSPARRQKVAIPIVDPTELKKKTPREEAPTPTAEISGATTGDSTGGTAVQGNPEKQGVEHTKQAEGGVSKSTSGDSQPASASSASQSASQPNSQPASSPASDSSNSQSATSLSNNQLASQLASQPTTVLASSSQQENLAARSAEAKNSALYSVDSQGSVPAPSITPSMDSSSPHPAAVREVADPAASKLAAPQIVSETVSEMGALDTTGGVEAASVSNSVPVQS